MPMQDSFDRAHRQWLNLLTARVGQLRLRIQVISLRCVVCYVVGSKLGLARRYPCTAEVSEGDTMVSDPYGGLYKTVLILKSPFIPFGFI